MADDKLKLLQVDQLTMGEVPTLEKMSGFSVIDIMDMDGGAIPMSVLMALGYLTEKRHRPQMKTSYYTKLSTAEFMQYLSDRFEFGTHEDDVEGEAVEDPTGAA